MGDAKQSPRRIGIAELERRLAVNRCTIWRWLKADRFGFPKPVYLGERRTWLESEIAAWEAEQAARPPESRRSARNLTKAALP